MHPDSKRSPLFFSKIMTAAFPGLPCSVYKKPCCTFFLECVNVCLNYIELLCNISLPIKRRLPITLDREFGLKFCFHQYFCRLFLGDKKIIKGCARKICFNKITDGGLKLFCNEYAIQNNLLKSTSLEGAPDVM